MRKVLTLSIIIAILLFASLLTISSTDLGNNEKEYHIHFGTAAAKAAPNSSYNNQGMINYTLFILLFLTYLVYRFYHLKNKEIYKTELRISQKLHEDLQHRIVAAFHFLDNKDMGNKENTADFRQLLVEMHQSARQISKENADIDTGSNYGRLLTETIENFSNRERKVVTMGIKETNWNTISKSKKITLYRIIQELLTNMEKHSNAKIVAILVTKKRFKLEVAYSDNGTIKETDSFITNMGQEIIKKRLQQIGGRITYNKRSEGFSLYFYFPIYSL